MRYMTALPFMFAVAKYRKTLDKICSERNIDVNFRHNLIEINYARKEATFDLLDESLQSTGTKTLEVNPVRNHPSS